MKGVVKVEEMWTQIANYGFPMVVSIYLLVRIESKLEDLTLAITKLRQVIESES